MKWEYSRTHCYGKEEDLELHLNKMGANEYTLLFLREERQYGADTHWYMTWKRPKR